MFLMLPVMGIAADAGHGSLPHLSGESLGVIWVVPFVGILLSIAIFPLVAPHFWHQNFGMVSLFWAVSLIIPFALSQGLEVTLYELLHVGLLAVSYTHLTLPTIYSV